MSDKYRKPWQNLCFTFFYQLKLYGARDHAHFHYLSLLQADRQWWLRPCLRREIRPKWLEQRKSILGHRVQPFYRRIALLELDDLLGQNWPQNLDQLFKPLFDHNFQTCFLRNFNENRQIRYLQFTQVFSTHHDFCRHFQLNANYIGSKPASLCLYPYFLCNYKRLLRKTQISSTLFPILAFLIISSTTHPIREQFSFLAISEILLYQKYALMNPP